MRKTFIKEVFFAEIEKQSQGRLKIEDHWNSKLARSYDALSVVKEGKVADMAIVVPEYTPKEFSLQQIFKSFPLGPTGDKQVEFFRKAYTTIPALQAEDKQAIQRAATKAYQSLGSVMDSSYDGMLDELRKNDVKMRELKPDELQRWEAATRYQEVQQKWVQEQASKGLKEAGPTMEKVTALMKEAMK